MREFFLLLAGIIFTATASNIEHANANITKENVIDMDMILPPGTTIDDFFVKEQPEGVQFSHTSSQEKADPKITERLWSLPIPYEIHRSIGEYKENTIMEAMSEFENKSCVTFREKVSTDQDYIVFVGNESGCFSYLGRIEGGQIISLGGGCGVKEIVVHQIMHALGFIHEESRNDRDDHVTILTKNIKDGKKHHFKRVQSEIYGDLGVGYDYQSVVHSKRYTFSRNNLPTIIRKDGNEEEFGQPVDGGLSEKDEEDVNDFYKCHSIGEWNSWDPYGDCSKSCGGGYQFRYRSCFGGICGGSDVHIKECNTQKCIGLWSSWGSYGDCSETCGGGLRIRYRSCTGSGICEGSPLQSDTCNSHECIGEWNSWSSYGFCSKTCGGGYRLRYRSCNGGICEGSNEQNEVCMTQQCIGIWSSWYSGSSCSATCGGGIRREYRNCVGGSGCPGSYERWERCNNVECDDSCFPADAVVRNDKGVKVSMKDLKIGEKVLTMDSNRRPIYSQITMMLHRETNRTSKDFVTIDTEDGSRITMTLYHLIPLSTQEFVFAKDVKPGQYITVFDEVKNRFHSKQVVSVHAATKTGLYAPLSNEGTMIVNGVHVSCYALFPSHSISHFVFSLWRILYANFESGLSQLRDDGMHWYPRMLMSTATHLNIL